MTLSHRIPLLAALMTAALAAAAPAQQEAFMTLKGQRQGTIGGDATQANHLKEMELDSFSAAPATLGAAPTAFTVKMSMFALPQILNAMVTNETVTPKFTFYHHDQHGQVMLAYTVNAALAKITNITFNTSAGSAYQMDVTITTVSAPAMTVAPGVAQTTAFPTFVKTSGSPSNVALGIRGDMIKGKKAGAFDPHARGPMQGIELSSVQFEVTAPAAGGGKPTFSKVVFTKKPDTESTPLMAAATSGEDLSGSVIKWYGATPSGAPKLLLTMEIGDGAFVPAAPSAGLGAASRTSGEPAGRVVNGVEQYVITLQAPPVGGYMIKLSRPTPPAMAQY